LPLASCRVERQQATDSPGSNWLAASFCPAIGFFHMPDVQAAAEFRTEFPLQSGDFGKLQDQPGRAQLIAPSPPELKYRATIMFSNRAEVPGTWAILFPTI